MPKNHVNSSESIKREFNPDSGGNLIKAETVHGLLKVSGKDNPLHREKANFKSEVIKLLYYRSTNPISTSAKISGDIMKGGTENASHCNSAERIGQDLILEAKPTQPYWMSTGFENPCVLDPLQLRIIEFNHAIDDLAMFTELDDILVPVTEIDNLHANLIRFELINSNQEPLNRVAKSCLNESVKNRSQERERNFPLLRAFHNELHERFIRWSPFVCLSNECMKFGYDRLSKNPFVDLAYINGLRFINDWLRNCKYIDWSSVTITVAQVMQHLRGLETKAFLLSKFNKDKLIIDPQMVEILGYLVYPYWIAEPLKEAIIQVNKGEKNHKAFRRRVFELIDEMVGFDKDPDIVIEMRKKILESSFQLSNNLEQVKMTTAEV